jgi:hypothetical protein
MEIVHPLRMVVASMLLSTHQIIVMQLLCRSRPNLTQMFRGSFSALETTTLSTPMPISSHLSLMKVTNHSRRNGFWVIHV